MPVSDSDKIVKTIDLPVAVSRVWNALTDHEAFGTWFRVALDQPFVEGGESTGKMTYPGHEGVPWLVYVEELKPMRRFSFRWYDSEDGTAGEDGQNPALRVEFILEDIPEGTRLTIIESGFLALPEAARIERMRSNTEGWDIQADNIARYLAK